MSLQLVVACLAVLVCAAALPAAEPGVAFAPAAAARPAHSRWQKRWIASWLAIVAVNAFDISSSRGHQEGNPLLRGADRRFAPGKAVLIKAAIGGGFFATQFWLARRHPERDYYKPFAVANSVVAGGLAGVAVHNYRLPPPNKESAGPLSH